MSTEAKRHVVSAPELLQDRARRSADAYGRARAQRAGGDAWTLDPGGLARVQRSAGNAAACLLIQRSAAAAPGARRAPPLPFEQVVRAVSEDAAQDRRAEASPVQPIGRTSPAAAISQRAATLGSHAAAAVGRVGALRPQRAAVALGGAAKRASTTIGRLARLAAAPAGLLQAQRSASVQVPETVAAPMPVAAAPMLEAPAAPAATEPPAPPPAAPSPGGASTSVPAAGSTVATRSPARQARPLVVGTPFGLPQGGAVATAAVQRAPGNVQRAPGAVTAVTPAQTELGVGRRMTVQATVTGSG